MRNTHHICFTKRVFIILVVPNFQISTCLFLWFACNADGGGLIRGTFSGRCCVAVVAFCSKWRHRGKVSLEQ